MDNKKNGIPKLRFPGFTGAWEQRKLGGFLQEYSIKSKIENEYPLLSSTNKGMEYREGRTASESNIGYKILKINDLVLSPQNLWLGNININTLVTGIVSPSYKTLKINNLSLYFLLPQLKTKRMLEKYKQVSVQGASVVRRNLDFTEFMNISLVIPTNKEQEQIGEFFKQLDSLIALHQRKLEHLQEQKKGLLQKMFPKNGEVVPEVRFPGFTDAWEQRKLGEVTEINPSSEIPDNFEYVDLESVVGTEMIAYRRENKETAPSRAQRLAKKGDIFYQTVRPYQKNNYHFNLMRKDFVFSTGYAQLRPNINGDFLFVYIQLNNFVNEVLNRSTGTSYPAISPSNLMKIKIAIPTNSEQEKIGKFFKQLDSLITLHQRKLEHLELMKKGLLQQMFV